MRIKNKNIKIKLLYTMISVIILFVSVVNNALAMNTSIEHSINSVIAEKQSTNNDVQESAQSNNSRFAFILFYLHSCPHCQRFDPILKTFSKSHNMPVLAYTLDGQSLPSFPNSVTPTQSEVSKFFPTQNPVVPTLFLMDEKTHQIYPVLQGEATEDQLSERLSQLINKIGEEKNESKL